MAQASATLPKNYYPKLEIPRNEHPNRWLNIPFIGILIRLILTIPVTIFFFFLGIYFVVLYVITPFYILFTGKYWDYAYTFFNNFMTYSVKLSVYLFGITEKYPGFNFGSNGLFNLHIDKPQKPSRFLAFPVIGFIVRLILLIPYLIFESVMQNGSRVAVISSWFVILFKGKYPESLHEFVREYLRVSIATSMYMFYLSDKYPSFHIIMKNERAKIILLVLGILLTIFGTINDIQNSNNDFNNAQEKNMQYNFDNLPVDFKSY